jgi:hypothetical protein
MDTPGEFAFFIDDFGWTISDFLNDLKRTELVIEERAAADNIDPFGSASLGLFIGCEFFTSILHSSVVRIDRPQSGADDNVIYMGLECGADTGDGPLRQH